MAFYPATSIAYPAEKLCDPMSVGKWYYDNSMDSKVSSRAQHQRFRWLPNGLSASRAVLALAVYIAAVHTAWHLALGLLCVALITDFFDGLAAKKLHAETTLGGHIDRVSDFLLATAGVFGLLVGTSTVPLWLICVGIPVSLFIGSYWNFRGGFRSSVRL